MMSAIWCVPSMRRHFAGAGDAWKVAHREAREETVTKIASFELLTTAAGNLVLQSGGMAKSVSRREVSPVAARAFGVPLPSKG